MSNTNIAGPNARTSLEAGTIFIPMWHSGLYTQRSPLFTPMSSFGLQMVQRMDTLWGGLNMELSLDNTLVRRPGFTSLCSEAFGSDEYPLTYYSFKNIAGDVYPLVDTQDAVYTFSPTTLTSIFDKTTETQTSFQKVGNTLYFGDSADLQQWTGSGSTFAIGLAVPTVAPTFTIGTGFLLPTVGFSYGYSYGNSSTGHVSTMSPASSDTGDLDVSTVTEASVTYQIDSLNVNDTGGNGPFTVMFGTPNGNNLWVGAKVTVSGNWGTAPNASAINGAYTVTVVSASSFGASTSKWGPPASSPTIGQNSNLQESGLTGVTAVLQPITIPGSTAADPYVYTVNQADIFAPTNAFDGEGSKSSMVVTGPLGTPVYTQIESGTPTTGQYVVNASTGQITFASADAGKIIILTYDVTPTTGGNPVGFIVTGPSSNNSFTGGTQTDITGYTGADNVVVYRSLDTDGTAGPWYLLSTIPNNLALTQAAHTSQTQQTVYTLANPCPAGANNGFASAAGTGGATIAGFSHSANNGTFDIIASTETTITCTNASGVNETHAATVNSSVWKYTDTGAVFGYAFDPTVPDGEVDELIEAPIDDLNDPPPGPTNPVATEASVFSVLCYNAGRLWGALGNYVYFAGGPDVTFGNGNEAWPPANVFTFPGLVTALASVSAGLLVFTETDLYIIYGTSTASFYSSLYQCNFGVMSQNCIAQDGDMLFVYTSHGQLFQFTDSLQEAGFAIGNILISTFNPAATYLALHRNGNDSGLFISDGSTNMFRYRLDQQSWSTVAQVVGGAGAIASIDLPASFGTNEHYWLLSGRATGSGKILGRTLGTFQDQGQSYSASAIIGSILVAPPGKTALVKGVIIDRMPVGTDAIVSILADEINGTFVNLPNPVTDPPLLKPSTSVISKKYWLSAAQQPIAQQMRHLQVQIAFNAENAQNELLSLGLG
jgi:hypothetical protein